MTNAAEDVSSDVSLSEYYRYDSESDGKHEFEQGAVLAMTGGSPEHALIGARLIVALSQTLEGGKADCRVYNSELRVRVPGEPKVYYPDATVVCGPEQTDDSDPLHYTVMNPVAVVEVLSPSTERRDRTVKAPAYRRIPTVSSVLLVHVERRLVEGWQRRVMGTDEWLHWSTDGGGKTLFWSLDLDVLYRGVRLGAGT